jgi:predicted ATPase
MTQFRPPTDDEILSVRDREVSTVLQLLDDARSTRIPRVVEVRGEPGIGKTALLRAIASRASKSGWLVASATCLSIQENVPFSAARRLVRELFHALSLRSESYVAGLDALFDDRGEPYDPVRALVRLLEGASFDFSVLLTIDDWQWADRDSSAALRDVLQNLTDCALAVQIGRRTGDRNDDGITPDSNLELEPLSDSAAASLLVTLASDIDPTVVNEIVRYARGNPFDLVALTQLVVEEGVFSEESVRLSRR